MLWFAAYIVSKKYKSKNRIQEKKKEGERERDKRNEIKKEGGMKTVSLSKSTFPRLVGKERKCLFKFFKHFKV